MQEFFRVTVTTMLDDISGLECIFQYAKRLFFCKNPRTPLFRNTDALRGAIITSVFHNQTMIDACVYALYAMK